MLTVPSSSPAIGMTLDDLDNEEMGARVIEARRVKKWIYDPEDDFRIRGGDILIVRGVAEGYDKFKTVLEKGPDAVPGAVRRHAGGDE